MACRIDGAAQSEIADLIDDLPLVARGLRGFDPRADLGREVALMDLHLLLRRPIHRRLRIRVQRHLGGAWS